MLDYYLIFLSTVLTREVVSCISIGIDEFEYEIVEDDDEFAVEYEIVEDDDKLAAEDEDEINDDDEIVTVGDEIVTVGDEIDDCEDKFFSDGVVIDDGDKIVDGTYELVDEEEIDTII
ncbi:unnamed protein product [Rotaria magnacalcarata]|uniref:Uncharacterized protein n=1 Tax=Rotaria magnacalcarata TaxID=392030 RepID=A0A816SZE2_9BILA|nr:unnamed protein product [Rotaria magnacalcarata]